MKSDELFENWKQQREDFAVSDNFCENIMQTMTTPKKQKKRVDLLLLFNRLTLDPIARFGVIAVGALGGLCRIVLTVFAMVFEGAPII